MGILFKKVLRDFGKQKGQFIAILIIITIGVMFYTGINSTFRNLSNASKKYYRNYRFADVWVSLYKAPEGVLDRVKSMPHVEMVTGRVVKDVKIDISDEDAVIRIITLPNSKKDIVNDIAIKSGRYFSNYKENQCLIEEEFFKAHNLKIGDFIYPIINGNEVKLQVTGAVKSPEYVYPLRDGGELMPDNRKFGVVYIKKSFGQSVFDYNGSLNDICIILDEKADVKQFKDDIAEVLEEFGVKGVTEAKDQISNRMLSEEMKGLKATGGAFPVVFFIVAAVIIYIMMGRMVENQRTQIGVLKAFGYSNSEILLHYLSYSVFAGTVGSIAGSILGMFLGKFFTELENQYFHLPPADMKIYPELALPASLLTLFFCLLAGYNSCKKVFRIMPSEAMRPKAPRAGTKTLIEKAAFVWNKLDYSWKITMRNIFRYKKRAALTSIGVVFSSALLIIGLGASDSINYMIEQQYSNIQNYDIKVNFTKLLNIDELKYIENIPHVREVEPLIETGVEISNGWKKKDVGYTAFVKRPELYRVTDMEGKAVELPSKGIMIPEKLGRVLGVEKYDIVYLKPFLPGKAKKEVKVKGFVSQYIGLNAYGSMDNSQFLIGEGNVANSAVIKLESNAYEQEVKELLKEIKTVSSIQSKSDALNNLKKNMGAMSASMGVMVVLAGVLAIAVVYNITTINIFERRRELATLKVLGFKDREVQKLVFNENFVITFLGIMGGLPFGRWLGVYMMSAFETDAYTFPFVAELKTYVISAILTAAFTLAANFILSKKIKSINMVEVLKSNE